MTEKQLAALDDIKAIGIYHDLMCKKPQILLFEFHKEGDKLRSVETVDNVEIDLKNEIVFPEGFDEEFLKRPKVSKKAKLEVFTKMMELVLIECYRRDATLDICKIINIQSFRDKTENFMIKKFLSFVACDDTDLSVDILKRMRVVYCPRDIREKALG